MLLRRGGMEKRGDVPSRHRHELIGFYDCVEVNKLALLFDDGYNAGVAEESGAIFRHQNNQAQLFDEKRTNQRRFNYRTAPASINSRKVVVKC